jgi:isomerase DpgB
MVNEQKNGKSTPKVIEYDLCVGSQESLSALTTQLNDVCISAEANGVDKPVVFHLGDTERDISGTYTPSLIGDVVKWERAVRRLERLDAATVSVIEHVCSGPALDVLLATDYRIALPGSILRLPLNDGRYWPSTSIYRLANQIGVSHARQLVLWTNEVTAERAEELSIVDALTADVASALENVGRMLSHSSGSDIAVRRRLLLESPSSSYEDAIGTHLAACDRELRQLGIEKP